MAKFYGGVGYGEAVENPAGSGIYVDVITERQCYGDIVRNSRSLESGQYLNNDISVGNSISIVADAYASEHFHAIKYVRWAGARWIVTSVEVQRPRLILQLGGVFNGPEAATP